MHNVAAKLLCHLFGGIQCNVIKLSNLIMERVNKVQYLPPGISLDEEK